MLHDQLKALADRIEQAGANDLMVAMAALQGLKDALPAADEAAVRPRVVESTDGALYLAARAVPNWSVLLEGTAHVPHGQWRCTLRPSGSRDDEEVIGTGHAKTPAMAIIAALLRVMAIRSKGYS